MKDFKKTKTMDLFRKIKGKMDKVAILFPKDSTTDPALFTPWSIMHFGSGFYLYLFLYLYTTNSLKTNFYIMLIIHTIYELKDLYITYFMGIKPGDVSLAGLIANSSFYNSIGDTISSILGFYVAYLFNNWLLVYKKKNSLKIIEKVLLFSFLIGSIFYNSMQKLG